MIMNNLSLLDLLEKLDDDEIIVSVNSIPEFYQLREFLMQNDISFIPSFLILAIRFNMLNFEKFLKLKK